MWKTRLKPLDNLKVPLKYLLLEKPKKSDEIKLFGPFSIVMKIPFGCAFSKSG